MQVKIDNAAYISAMQIEHNDVFRAQTQKEFGFHSQIPAFSH